MVAPYRLCGRIRNTCCPIIHKLYLFHVENLKHASYPYQNYTLTPSLQMEPTARIRQRGLSDRFGQVSHCVPTYPNIRVRLQFVSVIIRSACEEASFSLNNRPVLRSVGVDLWQRHSVCYATRNVRINAGMQVPLMFLLSCKRLVIKEFKLSVVAFV